MCFPEQHNIALPLVVLSALHLNTWQSKPSYIKKLEKFRIKIYDSIYLYIFWVQMYVRLCVCLLVAQLCPTLCHPMDCSPPSSSVQGILQAWILEWVAISLSRGSSQPRDHSWVSCFAGGCFTAWATTEDHVRLLRRFNIWNRQAWDTFTFSVTNVKFGHFCYIKYLDWATELNWTERGSHKVASCVFTENAYALHSERGWKSTTGQVGEGGLHFPLLFLKNKFVIIK